MGRVKARKPESKSQVKEEKILRALYALDDDPTLTLRDAEALYGVPRSTLSDRRSGKTKNRQLAYQHEQKLTPAMESAIEGWCQDMDDRGFPPRLDLLKGMARGLAQKRAEEENNKDLGYLGAGWISAFLNRHPSLSVKYSGQLDRQRAKANNYITLRDYFRKLQRLIRRHKFRPQNTYNMDEKGFIIGYSARAKVVCRAGRRNPHVTQDGTREMLTVLEGVSASDFILPPHIIYKGTKHYMGWHKDTNDPDAKFSYSHNGWTDKDLAFIWLRDHFDRFTAPIAAGLPRLLIIDGHSSHLSYEFCDYAIKHDIHLLCLPPHSTHLLQPLDVGLFGPLQHYYGKAADDHMRNTLTGIKKGTFWSFYCQARKQAYTPVNIRAAFRATGIYPFNPDAVLTKIPQAPPSRFNIHPNCNRDSIILDSSDQLASILKTPKNRRDLRQQTQAALRLVTENNHLAKNHNTSTTTAVTNNTIAVILRLSHLAEKALSQSQISAIQTDSIRQAYAGKKAAKTDRRVISTARVITGADIMRLRQEREEKDRKKAERAVKKIGSTRAKPSTTLAAKPHTKKSKSKSCVTINPAATIRISDSDSEAPSDISEDSFIDIDDFDSDTGEYLFEEIPISRRSQKYRKNTTKEPRTYLQNNTTLSSPSSPAYKAPRSTMHQPSTPGMNLRSRM